MPLSTAQKVAVLLGGGSLLPISDDFERPDGDLGNGWLYTAGKWTIASGAAVATPTLGANLFLNSTFAADTNWFKASGWSISGGLGVKAPAAGNREIRQAIATIGNWYRTVWTLSVYNAGSFWIYNDTLPTYASTGTRINTSRAIETSRGIEADPTSDGSIDDVMTYQITLKDCFCVRDLRTANVSISAPVSVASGERAGLAVCLDSITAPANFLIAETQGSRAILTKCVGGTYTELINSAITYADGRALAIVKNGTAVSLYYNGAQVSTTKTVTDAGIVNNTLHGLWSTAPENSFASVSVVNP